MVRIGSDPELFLVDSQGKFKSAIGLIGGTKHYPRITREDGCAVQEDNVACEFNIPPCGNAEAFIEAINFNLNWLKEHVESQGLFLNISASAEFPSTELDNPLAHEFGCEPDYNAWTGKINPKPKSRNKRLRSAGGHIHIETKKNSFLVARYFDLYVVVPSLQFDMDLRRRDLYGKAGACRPKPYGVECRSLSNFWLNSDELKLWVFNQTQRAAELADNDRPFSKIESEKIQTCINTSNLGLMREIIQEFGIEG